MNAKLLLPWSPVIQIAIVCVLTRCGHAQDNMRFEPQELPVTLQVGYAVRAVDVNNDKKIDIAIVDSKRVLWLENPSWTEHVIYETPDAK